MTDKKIIICSGPSLRSDLIHKEFMNHMTPMVLTVNPIALPEVILNTPPDLNKLLMSKKKGGYKRFPKK